MAYHTSQNLNNADYSRALDFFEDNQVEIYKRTDRMFAVLLPVQWLAAILISAFVSPYAWSEWQHYQPDNLKLSIILGGAIIALPTFLAIRHPGAKLTRHAIAIGQMMLSGLLIHLTAGRIETHFHIFGSLAFLSFYRDWRVLLSATLIVILDHYFRGLIFPFSVYGSEKGNEWRWIEHTVWIVFVDIILIVSINRTIFKMWQSAFRSADVEAQEEKYRAVVEQTNDGIAIIEPENLRIIECNDAFSNLLGCRSVEEAKTLRAKNFDRENELLKKNRLTELNSAHSSINSDTNLRRYDGSFIPVESTVNLITYAGRQVFCVNLKDITERKRSEAEVALLAIVAQKTHNAVIITDELGIIQWVNEGFTKLTGYTYDESIGELGYFLQGEKTDAATVEKIRTTMWARQPFTGEIYNYMKDGTGFWVSVSITPWRNEKGEIQGFVSILTDITERKAIEEKLRRAQDQLEARVAQRTAELSEAQQFLRKVIDSVPNLIFVKDDKKRFRLVNQAVADFHDTTADKLIGKTFADFSSGKTVSLNVLEADEKVLESKDEIISRELKISDSQDNPHFFQVVKVPLKLNNDDTKYMLGIVTDLTERRLLENRLRHSQKMESIGQLAAGIAHEINTPTQYVSDNTLFVRDSFAEIKKILQSFSELIQKSRAGEIDEKLIAEIDKKIRRCDLEFLIDEIPVAIDQSLEGISRITKIVQSMRTFAHPGAIEKQPADINKAIETTISVAHNEWKYVAELETFFDETLPPVPCLLDDFNRVILNMIINATHSIAEVVGTDPRVKGKITIKTARVADRWAEIQITDTGAGIPPEVQNRIFDPFFTTKEVGKGTGQGLAISHNVIVEKHKGQISFESKPGSGTTFFIRLPLDENSEKEMAITS